MRILVVGCGYVGRALLPHLTKAGHAVFAMRRSAAPASPDLEGVESIRGDVLRAEDLGRLPGEIDAVVYTVSADRGDEASYRRAYVEGVGALGEFFAGRRDPLPRFLFASSTSVYGQSHGEWRYAAVEGC